MGNGSERRAAAPGAVDGVTVPEQGEGAVADGVRDVRRRADESNSPSGSNATDWNTTLSATIGAPPASDTASPPRYSR